MFVWQAPRRPLYRAVYVARSVRLFCCLRVCLGFGVWGLGFGDWGLGFGVWVCELRVLGFVNAGLGVEAWVCSSGFQV